MTRHCEHVSKNLADASGLKVAMIVSQFNSSITERLLDGAFNVLKTAGVSSQSIEIVKVPGALEIPVALKAMIETRKWDAYICLGAVIRGETSHYDVVVNESSHGVMTLSRDYGIPLGFGILTCETLDQAMDRSGGKVSNAGSNAARAALEMAQLLKNFKKDL